MLNNRQISPNRNCSTLAIPWCFYKISRAFDGFSTSIIWQKYHPPELKHRPIFTLVTGIEYGFRNSVFYFLELLNGSDLSGGRVPVLSIGNFSESSNNLIPRVTKMSAIFLTVKAFFERLYLVLGLSPFDFESTVPMYRHPHCSLENYFSISVQLSVPLFLSAHDSSSNLA